MAQDPDSRTTPEKQLLKLIEEPDAANVDKVGSTYRTKRFLSGGFLAGITGLFGKKGAGGLRKIAAPSVDIEGINLILKLCIIATAAYLVFYVVMSMKDMAATPKLFVMGTTGSATGKEANVAEIQASLQPTSYYLDKAGVRDIFSPFVEKMAETPVLKKDEKPAPSAEMAGFVESLRLVGIAWMERPEVIIENTKMLKTFFLKEGDSFMDAKVKKIYPDRVVIVYKGQESELR